MWCVGLNDDFALEFATTCTASDLGEELKGALASAKIWHMQTEVCVEHSYEGDVGKVEAFGDHLGADDDVDFTLAEFLQGITERVFAAHGIGVDAGDSCLWKYFFDDTFNLLSAVALAANSCVATLRTFFWWEGLVTTHVADEPVITSVVGERNGTMATFADVATAWALNGAGESTTIEKQDDLLTLI